VADNMGFYFYYYTTPLMLNLPVLLPLSSLRMEMFTLIVLSTLRRTMKIGYSLQALVYSLLFFYCCLLPIICLLFPLKLSSGFLSHSRVINGLISTPDISGSSGKFGNTNGSCVNNTNSSEVPAFRLPIYADLKSQFFTQSKLTSTLLYLYL